ncbi:CoA transferase [Nocardia sp. NPDC127606]|uniref:CoA transferase n=1 Tax=Nocardia sp. NPDC127606 TaxID=3345406 RepID=UPI003644FA5E
MTAADWAGCGALWLTGDPDGAPDQSRSGVLDHARAVADGFTARTGVPIDVGAELTRRAALLGLTRRGRISAGGASRLIATRDGWCALTLARDVDREAIPALLETTTVTDPWSAISHWAADVSAAEVTARARLLGLPVAALGEQAPARPVIRRIGPAGPPRSPSDCLVVDLSSMWAGPLCGRLLREAGATVVKVESPSRPDGTRRTPRFFDWMNAGKLCYSLDFDEPEALRSLLARADVVLESSRPSALTRRGLGPDLPARPGRVWARITAHGNGIGANWAGFGDDAAVAGGLVGIAEGGPYFCADAIADPLTGLEAARSVVEALARGGGELVEVSLSAVAAEYAAIPTTPTLPRHVATRPASPRISGRASAPGADRDVVHALASAPAQ